MSWVLTDEAWAAAGVFAWLSLFLTCHQIYKHLYHYTKPQFQKWICRILYMAPIYAFASWLSLRFFNWSVYFDTVRNCYEAFVIYSFLSLCFAYLGGESAIVHALTGRAHKPSIWLCTCCVKPFPYSISFLLACKRCTLQFCVIKPVTSAVTLALESKGWYSEGDLDPKRGYLYIAIVYNLSILFAMLALVWFYVATKEFLAPHKPVLKFLIVKSVIFLAFWQGVGLAVAEKLNAFAAEDTEPGKLAAAYQNFFICVEMFFISVAHLYAFPYQPYINPDDEEMGMQLTAFQRVSSNLKKTLNPRDIVDDTVRNFSSKYNNYHQQADHDSEEEEDDLAGGDLGLALRNGVMDEEEDSPWSDSPVTHRRALPEAANPMHNNPFADDSEA